ncbi:MAG: VOC family protein [Ancrocorticia sp.]|uniref:VOC family protein n=1 Tax=Ancrocorticia sp. TaxID=2593684 RepID=UPI003F8E5310
MPQPTGTPTWLDLGTNKAAASRDFYHELFGWNFVDQGAEVGHYEMVLKDGNIIAGFMDMAGMNGPDGNPITDRWDVFLAVDDIAARVELAKAHGATVYSEPMEIPESGLMAIIVDPTGAFIGLWEARGFVGYTFTGTAGTPVWFELLSNDFDTAVAFYRDVFDFDIAWMSGEDEGANRGDDGEAAGQDAEASFRYVTNGAGEKACAGILDATAFLPPGASSFWRVYFDVEATEPALAKVRELGGQIVSEPMDSPFGRCTTVADPAGATLVLNAGSEALRG